MFGKSTKCMAAPARQYGVLLSWHVSDSPNYWRLRSKLVLQSSNSLIPRSSGSTLPSYSCAQVHCCLRYLPTYSATLWDFRSFKLSCVGTPIAEDVCQISKAASYLKLIYMRFRNYVCVLCRRSPLYIRNKSVDMTAR